ncbi:MAG: hypothetical protein ABI237_08295 [Ginsengibacter sp.]
MFQNKIYTRESLMYKIILLRIVGVLLLLLSIQSSYGQKKNSITHLSLRAMAKAYGDSVVIRWAPGSATAWKLCNDSGYQVIRIDYSNPEHPVNTLLTPNVLFPMTLDQMEKHLDTTNKYAAIAAQAMYGNNFELTSVPPSSFGDKMNQERSAMNFRFSFAMMSADFSAPVASALALRWVDRGVKRGGNYRYIIFSHGAEKDYRVDSVAVSVVNIKGRKEAVPQGLKAFGFDRKIELHWNRRQLPGYDAYNIERSDDHGKNYHLVNKNPFYSPYEAPTAKKKDSLQMKIASVLRDHEVFFDSIPQNYKTYYYRISGLNAFGEKSPFTDTVAVNGIDLTPPLPPDIDSAHNFSGNEIKISWTQHNGSPDLIGYVMTRSNNPLGPFYPISSKLLSKKVFSFNDTAAVAHEPNYYEIIAMDSAGNVSYSLPKVAYLTDTIPPAPPTGVTGFIDSSGVVHLKWNKNTEPDFKGYKVYYSYNPNYEFSQITHFEIPETTYTDTVPMNTLNRKVYYRVVAVDRNNNHSDYSDLAELRKPVVIPPSSPEPGDVSVEKSGAHIVWFESRSDGAAGYEIYRQEKGKDWQPIARLDQDFSVTSLVFTDSTIRPNTDYYYAAETIDSTGIHSGRSFAVHVRYAQAHTLPAPDSPLAQWDNKQKEVKLSWQYTNEDDYFIIVYKASEGGTLVPWHSFDKGTQSCQDNQVKKGSYQYAIKVVLQDHSKNSPISKPVEINVPDNSL